jgi:hypothetical protein
MAERTYPRAISFKRTGSKPIGEAITRLASVKKTYDPAGFFFVHNGVGSEEWSDDGFVRKAHG